MVEGHESKTSSAVTEVVGDKDINCCKEVPPPDGNFNDLQATVKELSSSVVVMSGLLQDAISRVKGLEIEVETLYSKLEYVESQYFALVRDTKVKENISNKSPSGTPKETKTESENGKGGSLSKMTSTMINEDIMAEPNGNEEEYDIVVDVSEEEDSFERILKWTPKVKSPCASERSTTSPPPINRSFAKSEFGMYCRPGEESLSILASNFRRGVKTEDNSTNDKLKGKKLSFTPTCPQSKLKIPKVESEDNNTPRKRSASEIAKSKELIKRGKNIVQEGDDNKNAKPFSKIAPKFVRTKFKPLKEMHLTSKEERISLYVFRADGDAEEVLYKIGDTSFTRKDLSCFAYPYMIRFEIISAIIQKFIHTQREMKTQTYWMLPPTFVGDVHKRTKVESMLDSYATEWMPPFVGLKYIYVPVQEVTSQWFLIVISITEKVVYHLDSFLVEQSICGRHQTIRAVCKVLGQCTSCEYYPSRYFSQLADMEDWEIKIPDNLPDDPYGENSAVWMIEWLHMRDAFHTNITNKMNEKVARMRICLGLICGDHNDKWDELQANSDNFWKEITG